VELTVAVETYRYDIKPLVLIVGFVMILFCWLTAFMADLGRRVRQSIGTDGDHYSSPGLDFITGSLSVFFPIISFVLTSLVGFYFLRIILSPFPGILSALFLDYRVLSPFSDRFCFAWLALALATILCLSISRKFFDRFSRLALGAVFRYDAFRHDLLLFRRLLFRAACDPKSLAA